MTDSGTRLLFEDELLSGVSFSLARGWRGSDPVVSGVDWLGLLVDALPSPEGRIFRNDIWIATSSRNS